MKLGIILKRYRTKNKITLREFAARTNCSYEYIRQIESSDFVPTNINKLLPILSELGITLDQYIKDEQNEVNLATSQEILTKK